MGMHVIGYDPVMTPDAFQEVPYPTHTSMVPHCACIIHYFDTNKRVFRSSKIKEQSELLTLSALIIQENSSLNIPGVNLQFQHS